MLIARWARWICCVGFGIPYPTCPARVGGYRVGVASDQDQHFGICCRQGPGPEQLRVDSSNAECPPSLSTSSSLWAGSLALWRCRGTEVTGRAFQPSVTITPLLGSLARALPRSRPSWGLLNTETSTKWCIKGSPYARHTAPCCVFSCYY